MIGPFKGINKEIKGMFPDFYIKNRVLKLRFSAFSRGYGGFRELREAGRKHFHLSRYLLVPGVTSSRNFVSDAHENIRFNNSGLTLEFRFLVGIWRSDVMIGRLCLNMIS